MSFHVGQKVECVDDKPNTATAWDRKTIPPIKGSHYIVRDVGPTVYGEPGLKVHGAELTGDFVAKTGTKFHDYFFVATRFRPLIEKKLSTETGMAILRKIAQDASKEKELVIEKNIR